MKSTDLVDAMNALNVVRARKKAIVQINKVIGSDDPTKLRFRITNDNGDSFQIENQSEFLGIIREAYRTEIEENMEILAVLGVDIDPDDEEDEDEYDDFEEE